MLTQLSGCIFLQRRSWLISEYPNSNSCPKRLIISYTLGHSDLRRPSTLSLWSAGEIVSLFSVQFRNSIRIDDLWNGYLLWSPIRLITSFVPDPALLLLGGGVLSSLCPLGSVPYKLNGRRIGLRKRFALWQGPEHTVLSQINASGNGKRGILCNWVYVPESSNNL